MRFMAPQTDVAAGVPTDGQFALQGRVEVDASLTAMTACDECGSDLVKEFSWARDLFASALDQPAAIGGP